MSKTPVKRALGKGLDALIEPITSGEPEATERIERLSVEEIRPARKQPRDRFDEAKLEELAASIKSQGIIQPIVVEKINDGYTIIAGERRYRAAKIAGLSEVPVVIKQYGEKQRYLVSLVENIQREDLDPIEEAKAYEQIIKTTGISQDDLGDQVGKNRATVANTLRLLKLPVPMQDSIQSGEMSPGHARAILSLVNPADRERLFKRITSEQLSVREAERAASSAGDKRKSREGGKKSQDPEVKRIEQQFIEVLGTKTQLKGSLSKGILQISYYSQEDLERLYDIIIDR